MEIKELKDLGYLDFLFKFSHFPNFQFQVFVVNANKEEI
jgi:hypothetical protein